MRNDFDALLDLRTRLAADLARAQASTDAIHTERGHGGRVIYTQPMPLEIAGLRRAIADVDAGIGRETHRAMAQSAVAL